MMSRLRRRIAVKTWGVECEEYLLWGEEAVVVLVAHMHDELVGVQPLQLG